ncbi:MAG: hypothetical protein AAFX53_11700 [Bacteroidota bacterium]
MNRGVGLLCLVFLSILSCMEVKEDKPDHYWIGVNVMATAYNSLPTQTHGHPNIAAWGDTLIPGNKVIAVSRDLLGMGLERNTMVRITGFPDTFYIKDKMHRKWKRRIDIYMGEDYEKAKQWGRRKVCMEYAVGINDLD